MSVGCHCRVTVAKCGLASVGKVTIMAASSDQTLKRVIHAAVDQLEALVPTDGGRSSAQLPQSSVREQCGQVLFLLTDALQTIDRPTNTRAGSLSEHLLDRQHAEQVIRSQIRSVTGSESSEQLAPQAQGLAEDLRSTLLGHSLPATVASQFGTVRIVDYLRGLVIESVAAAMRFRAPIAPPALTEASRALAAVMGARHPGAAIELRVPPATAVQLGAFGEGPSHTRGTPPNVVETDPTTFVAMATGLRGWDRELAAHRVRASGAHTNALAGMLPVITLAR